MSMKDELQKRLNDVRVQRMNAEQQMLHLQEQARNAERLVYQLQGAESALVEVLALMNMESAPENE